MDMALEKMHRRDFCRHLAGLAATGFVPATLQMNRPAFRLRYVIASSMYGRMKLADVLAEVHKAGAEHIDIWPEPHANHREQIEAMGHGRFAAMLTQYRVKLGILTHYDLGPFGLQEEMKTAKKLGGSMVICGSRGPGNLKGDALKTAIIKFLDQMKPHIDAAQRSGVTIGIENHADSLIQSPDSIRWFAQLSSSKCIGIALAPYHLPQDPVLIGSLVSDIGERLVHFYAWQYGQGCQKKLPKELELLQLPGCGDLDFTPIIDGLKAIGYKGWTEVFMHPVPRGDAIMPTASEVTAQINRARYYLEACLAKVL